MASLKRPSLPEAPVRPPAPVDGKDCHQVLHDPKRVSWEEEKKATQVPSEKSTPEQKAINCYQLPRFRTIPLVALFFFVLSFFAPQVPDG